MKKDTYYTFEGIKEQEHAILYLMPRKLFYVNTTHILPRQAIELARKHFEPEYTMWRYWKGWWAYDITKAAKADNSSIDRFLDLRKIHD